MGLEDQKTETDSDGPIWYPSVQTTDELPALAEPNARCRVLATGDTWLYFGGQWRMLPKPPPPKRR